MSGAVANIWSVVTVTLISSASGAFRYSPGINGVHKIRLFYQHAGLTRV